jgi:hypothetical protein
MKNLILLALMFTACGSDDENSPASDESKPLQSVTLNSKKDLPACGTSNDKQLAYVIDEEQFYTCDGDWLAIEISSEAIEGPKGKDGEDGDDGLTVTVNNWFDAVNNKLWLIGPTGSYATFLSTCASPWRVPTKDETLAAMQRGLGLAAAEISGPSTAWTSDVWDVNASHNFIIQAIATTPTTNGADRLNDTRGVFCIED